MKVILTADDIAQALGEYLYNRKKLPEGYEDAKVNFEVEDGKFVVEITETTPSLQSIN
jgi:hypothetical protein|tara:strand:- start:154 stop:327 length:174 start_codon:yes stop_codon:yes gene_type:complete